ncbi:scavenger receptor class F member 2-like [Crassostrea virginica]
MKAFSFIAYMIIAEMNAHVCNNQSDGCCQDFQLKDGICEPCFGSWGINCTQNCTPGYYGFNCRSRCLCHPYQLCDKIFGCRDNLSKGLLSILYNLFILCYLKSTKHAIQIRIF